MKFDFVTFMNLKNQLNNLLESAAPQNHESFFVNFFISNESRLEFVRRSIFSFENFFVAPIIKNLEIPRKIHRLWLTSPNSPQLPPERYLIKIKMQAHELGSGFDYIFWSNSHYVEEYLNEFFSGLNFQFIDVTKIPTHPRLLSAINHAISEQKFVLAGDILKFAILEEFGGIYADMGIDFRMPLLELVMYSNMSLFLDHNIFFQPAFMAALPHARPLQIFCDLLCQPEILTSIGLPETSEFSPGHEIWIHGGIGFTAVLMLIAKGQPYHILPIPANQGLLHVESEGSWYKQGNKFGNVTIDLARVSHLDRDTHLTYVLANKQLDSQWAGVSGASLVMLKIAKHLEDRQGLTAPALGKHALSAQVE